MLKVHAPTEAKINYLKDNFCEELKRGYQPRNIIIYE
jgi:hypothetical protein